MCNLHQNPEGRVVKATLCKNWHFLGFDAPIVFQANTY